MPAESAAEVFALLSDETRVDVLRAVARAEHDAEIPDAGRVVLSFSELYDRVDVDNTSKLSYHLGELAGPFLRKSEDGYALTHAGEYLVRFVLSGNYERPAEFGPTEVDGLCPFCGGTELAASLFERQIFVVTCAGCERPVAGLPTTAAQGRERDDEAYVESVKRGHAAQVRQMQRGVCPTCSGRMTAEVLSLDESPLPEVTFVVDLSCESCLRRYSMPLPYVVAQHPASVAFHWERGVDVTRQGFWEFHEHFFEGRWGVSELDGGRYEVSMRRDGDVLRLVVDGAARVLRTERVERARGPGDGS
jgi:DNA-binding transcriptional ArsR family regulator